eukprot:GHVU01191589.1.p1 GENE.GHVU01191589.1~~GHVU01191589.1.p1  ORF type:complete len:100 (+),score=10.27 GHVU01191589.1:327-626(+)
MTKPQFEDELDKHSQRLSLVHGGEFLETAKTQHKNLQEFTAKRQHNKYREKRITIIITTQSPLLSSPPVINFSPASFHNNSNCIEWKIPSSVKNPVRLR